MADLSAPWLTACVAFPLVAAFGSRLAMEKHQRPIAVSACCVSLLLALRSVQELANNGWQTLAEPGIPAWFQADALNAVMIALFALLALIGVISAPRRDVNHVFSLLVLTSGTFAAYAAGNPTVFVIGWTIALLPAWKTAAFESIASTQLLALGAILHAWGVSSAAAFACLVLAAILRAGLFPFHRLAVSRIESSPLLTAGLLANAHLGMFLVIRFAIPLYPELAQTALPWLCALALLTGTYTAVQAIGVTEPRRAVALVVVSQACAIFAGLLTARPEGTTGGLLQWLVLGLASTTMFAILGSIEARINQSLSGDRLFGLVSQMPRLAVLFAVSALALVGLPGTLGFPGEDLLIHGILSAHPVLGILLPVSIAINAYSLYRLFSRLFLGAPIPAFNGAPDALPRERWALSAALLLLVLGGLLPDRVIALRSTAADLLATWTNVTALR